MMKRVFLVINLIFWISISSRAQQKDYNKSGPSIPGIDFGTKLGAVGTKINHNDFYGTIRYSYQAGVYLSFEALPLFSFQTEFLYNRVRVDNLKDYPGLDAGLKGMGYWSIPVLLQLKPVNFIRIGLGPQWNFQSNRDKYKLQNGQDAFKNYVSLALDAQLKLSSKTRIYFRYNKGLQSFENLTTRDAPRMNRLEFGLMQSLILN
jgi:hypothetical protein